MKATTRIQLSLMMFLEFLFGGAGLLPWVLHRKHLALREDNWPWPTKPNPLVPL